MDKQLHRHIGVITSLNKYKIPLHGTSILISPDLVLTCAHNIYDKNTSSFNSEVKFYPGHSGILKSSFEVESFFIPEQYKTWKKSCLYDYGLLKLKQKTKNKDFIPLN